MTLTSSKPWLAVFACVVAAGLASCTRSSEAVPRPACESGDESVQRRGTACLCCHADDFGVAGSVDLGGAPVSRLVVRAANGDTADMAPNPFGNFFRHLRLEGPLDVTVYGPDGGARRMALAAPHGDCNACHHAGGEALPVRGP